MSWLPLAIGIVAGLALIWVVLVLALYLVARHEDDPATLSEAVRLAPDVVRLVRRLAGDPTVPSGIRWRLVGLLVYLISPIDLIPDFIPVVGYADDAVVLALVLRSVVRAAGPDALDRHWPGTAQGLLVVHRLAGVQGTGFPTGSSQL